MPFRTKDTKRRIFHDLGGIGTVIHALDGVKHSGTLDLLTQGSYVPVNKAGDTMTGNLVFNKFAPRVDLKGSGSTSYLGFLDTLIFERQFTEMFCLDYYGFSPILTNQRDLGTTSLKWKDIYVAGLVDGVDVGSHTHGSASGEGVPVKRIQTGSGTPSGLSEGYIYFDKDNGKLWVHDGTTQKSVTLA